MSVSVRPQIDFQSIHIHDFLPNETLGEKLTQMSFYGMKFGEVSNRHPPMKDRGMDSRYLGTTRPTQRDPTPTGGVAFSTENTAQNRISGSCLVRDGCNVADVTHRHIDPSSTRPAIPLPSKPMAIPHQVKPTQAKCHLTVPTSHESIAMFKRFDFNNNGKLSLAEIDKAVKEIWPHYNNKPAMMRAYKACDVNGDGFVVMQEFPLFLRYLARFNDLWMAFEAMDHNHDRRISEEEFVRGRALFGLGHRSTHEVQQLFNAIDTNRGGHVLFDELAAYVAGNELNAERQLLKTQMKRPTVNKKVEQLEFLEMPSLPREQDLFSRLDMNRNGMLSLAELDKAVVELWPRFNNKPALMRAYKASDTNGNGFLGRKEFKLFLTFIVVYANLFNRFAAMDVNGDRRLSLHEFLTSKANAGRSQEELRKLFSLLDTNRGGYILFDEFCELEARRTLEHLQSANPSLGQGGEQSRYTPCIQGLLCLYCGKSVPDLDFHLPLCRGDHLKVVQSLPAFLRISLPEMPLPIPTSRSQVQVYNETAHRLFKGLSIIECTECLRKFPLLQFAGHLKTHSISYDRRMELMKRVGKGVGDVPMPTGVVRPAKEITVNELRKALLNGFDTSSIALLRRLLFLQAKQCPTLNAVQLQKMLGQCGLVGDRTFPQLQCSVLLNTFNSTEMGSAAALLSALDVPLSHQRHVAMQQCFASLDVDGSQSVPYRVIKEQLTCKGLHSAFSRPAEKVVTFREFEQVIKDLDLLFDSDADFYSLFHRVEPKELCGNSFKVVATLSNGSRQIVQIDVAPGSLVRKDPKSLLRRLTLIGVEDVVKVDLL